MISNVPSISADAIVLLKEFEGCKLESYYDSAGVLTIGFGDTNDVYEGQRITYQEAEHRLRFRLKQEFEEGVWRACCEDAPTSQKQFDAMVLLAYNIGVGAFQRSKVCEYHSEGLYREAEQSFRNWTKAGGVVLAGLVRRRAKEAHWYNIGTEDLRNGPSAALRV